ncbi:MAG: chromosome partitioning protein [Betaproteobacteria bacterium RIFCSPLOWO2_02_FULL_63_19]|nr:MAG: chromosome partitioning protein [Betaproteobacteria bacterium RIFCSPLOWO2_02_FULL_63_19]
MSIPVLTFFNNKGGVGKTSLVYHLAWMFSEMGKRVVAIDLDPQANLTSAFLPEEQLEQLWDVEIASGAAKTIYQCVSPLTEVGDIREPEVKQINSRLSLVPGDLGLAGFEDFLSQEWPNSLGSGSLYRPFRMLSAFWQISQLAAQKHNADLILADVGPNLGAINRSALIGSDHVVIPLAADLFSLQGLRNLGPTLRAWRADWKKRVENWPQPAFALPAGSMKTEGYIVQQHTERLSRPVKAYDKWAARIPSVYRSSVLHVAPEDVAPESDAHCLARLKHYRSLVPMAQEVRKPIFQLTAADGAIGSHSYAVTEARTHFRMLAKIILGRIGISA